MKCPNCGSDTPANEPFCHHCGTDLPQSEPAAPASGNKCPHCGARIEEGDLACGLCGAVLKKLPASKPAEGDNLNKLSLGNWAREADVDIKGPDAKPVPANKKAEEKQNLLKQFPVAESAYKPSGKMDTFSLPLLFAGMLLAIPGAFIGGAGVMLVGALLFLLLYGILYVAAHVMPGAIKGCCMLILLLAFLVLCLAIWLGTFAMMGFVAAYCVVHLGKAGHNRNAPIACIFSAAATIAVLMIFFNWVALELYEAGDKMNSKVSNMVDGSDKAKPDARSNAPDKPAQTENPDEEQPKPFRTTFAKVVGWIIMVISYITALAAAITMVPTLMQDLAYCEVCKEYMKKTELRQLSLPGVRGAMVAFKAKRFDILTKLHQRKPGQTGPAMLYRCDKCGRGFYNLSYRMAYRSADEGGGIDHEEWCIASAELDPKAAKLLLQGTKKDTSKDDEDTDESASGNQPNPPAESDGADGSAAPENA